MHRAPNSAAVHRLARIMRTMNTERRGLRRLIQRRRMSAPAPPILKTPAEIESLRRSGRLVAEAFTLLGEAIAPGVRLIDLDAQISRSG